MPRGDRTGPNGMGSWTGRGAGFCAGFARPGVENPLPGRGLGMGFARGRGALRLGFGNGGRGWRNMFYATNQPGWLRYGSYASPAGDLDPQEEKQMLKNQADAMQNELDSIRKRLEEMEKEQPSK